MEPDYGRFEIELPVWLIVSDPLLQTNYLPGAMVPVNFPKYGRCLLVFTDKDLAERVIPSIPVAECFAFPVQTAEQIAELVLVSQNNGDSHVAIDPSFGKQWRARFVPIGAFLAACRSATWTETEDRDSPGSERRGD